MAQLCLILCDPMDCSPPGSSVLGISQAIILEWVAIFRGRAAPLASIRQMSRQVSRGSAGEDQADEQAGVARLRWRVSGR